MELKRENGRTDPELQAFDAYLSERAPELFDPGFWLDIQERLMEGEIMDTYPYPRDKRLQA